MLSDAVTPRVEEQYVTVHQPEGKEEYRRRLMASFLYKHFIAITQAVRGKGALPGNY